MWLMFFVFSLPQYMGSGNLKVIEGRVDRDFVYTQQGVQIIVHIWGMVRAPGEYIVPDGSNLIDIVSLAGGPNDYADLGRVKLIRKSPDGDRIISINLAKYLKDKKGEKIPTLMAGDVVYVYPNWWYRWKKFTTFVSQVAIIVGAYYLIIKGK